MMDKMPEDLRWLAENVTEWYDADLTHVSRSFRDEYNVVIWHDSRDARVSLPDNAYSRNQWQAARNQLEDERMDIVGTNGNDGLHYDSIMAEEEEAEYMEMESKSKYHVEIRPGVFVDVYDVLHAFRVTNPGDQHAIKKMLMPGKRGVKSANQDRREAIQSLERAIELEGGE